MVATGSDDPGTNPIAEKRRQRKLENQRLEAAARQRQEDLRLQKERELKRQEDERIAAEQRRLDEIERLTRLREAERERIATIERNEANRVRAIERRLKLIGAFCTREIPLASAAKTRPQCCAVLSPMSLEKPIAGVEEPLAFVADASCHVRVFRLRESRCLFRIRFDYDTASTEASWTEAATTPLSSLCTTRSGHLIVCNQQLGVVGAYDINQLITQYRPLCLPGSFSKETPVVKATPALAATFVFPKSSTAASAPRSAPASTVPESRIRAICVDDTANELFVSDRLRHCIHVLAMNPSAFQRETAVVSTTTKNKAPISLARTFGSKGHGRGQLLGPAGLDISHYHTLVCDRGNHRIAAFMKRGTFVCTFGSKGCLPGQFLDPRDVKLANVRKRAISRGIQADENGISNEQFEIVVADLGNFRVQVLNEAGEPLRVLSMLAGSDQIRFHQDFLAARYARLLELYAAIDSTLPSLAGTDLREFFALGERLHPSSKTYQQITDNIHAVREDATRFHHPRAVAYLSKEREIVVLDRQNDHLFVYSIDGSMSVWSDLPIVSSEPSPEPSRGLSSAHSSLVIHDRVYVSDTLSHRIAVLTYPSLVFERFIGATTYGDHALCSEGFIPGELRFPTYLATYKPHGGDAPYLLVADSGNHCVSVFDASSGAFGYRIGQGFGHLEGFFDSPQGLAVFENRWLYVCDQRNHRVQIFDLETNAFVRSVGAGDQGTAPGAFSFPLSVAVCGGLHTVDKCNFGAFRDAKYCVGDAGNHRVQVLDMRDDSVLFVLDVASTPFETPLLPSAVVFHERCSYLLVADTNNKSVAIFRHDGTFVAAFGSNLEPENCFQRPTGLQLLLVDSSSRSSDRGDLGTVERVAITDAIRMALCTFELRP